MGKGIFVLFRKFWIEEYIFFNLGLFEYSKWTNQCCINSQRCHNDQVSQKPP